MPEITEVFYPQTRSEWRSWLEENHKVKQEIWVRLFRKATGKPSLVYDELVEECLCFGWIDGIVKKYDAESRVQRITPRRKRSFLSELNRQRIWKLQALDRMAPAGIEAVQNKLGAPTDALVIPEWIQEQLQKDPEIWENFQSFSYCYKRLKIRWIVDTGHSRQEESQKRLDYLLKMTKMGKQYGTRPMADVDH